MTEWVQIKNPEQPNAPDSTVSKKSWVNNYKPRGWKLVNPPKRTKGDDK